MKTRLVAIGNSKGIRLPKTVFAEARLDDQVELKAEPGCIIIRSARRPRDGWSEAAQQMRERDDDRFPDLPTATRFDKEEWEWR